VVREALLRELSRFVEDLCVKYDVVALKSDRLRRHRTTVVANISAPASATTRSLFISANKADFISLTVEW
jgi:hypothetical protein